MPLWRVEVVDAAGPMRNQRAQCTSVWLDLCDFSGATSGKEATVLWTIFVILLVLWLLGLVSGYTLGGFIHILLIIAIVVILIRLISGRRPI